MYARKKRRKYIKIQWLSGLVELSVTHSFSFFPVFSKSFVISMHFFISCQKSHIIYKEENTSNQRAEVG